MDTTVFTNPEQRRQLRETFESAEYRASMAAFHAHHIIATLADLRDEESSDGEWDAMVHHAVACRRELRALTHPLIETLTTLNYSRGGADQPLPVFQPQRAFDFIDELPERRESHAGEGAGVDGATANDTNFDRCDGDSGVTIPSDDTGARTPKLAES